jgi:hypothetical protein
MQGYLSTINIIAFDRSFGKKKIIFYNPVDNDIFPLSIVNFSILLSRVKKYCNPLVA